MLGGGIYPLIFRRNLATGFTYEGFVFEITPLWKECKKYVLVCLQLRSIIKNLYILLFNFVSFGVF